MSYVPGDIVKFHNPAFPQKSHRHIIVARLEEYSYLVVCSSQVDDVKAECAYTEEKSIQDRLITYVEIPAGVAPSLTKTSAINCNKSFRHDLLELQQKEEVEFEATQGDNVGSYYLNAIKKAMCDSKTTDPTLRALLGCP